MNKVTALQGKMKRGLLSCMRPSADSVVEPLSVRGAATASKAKVVPVSGSEVARVDDVSTVASSADLSSRLSSPAGSEMARSLSTSSVAERCGSLSLARQIAKALERRFVSDRPAGAAGRQTCFASASVPPVSVRDYLLRLAESNDCTPESLVLALIYVDRVAKRHVTLSLKTVHRLFATALVLAIKYHDDYFYSNEHYAEVAGVSLKELNKYEVELLRLMNWELGVKRATYDEYLCNLLPEML